MVEPIPLAHQCLIVSVFPFNQLFHINRLHKKLPVNIQQTITEWTLYFPSTSLYGSGIQLIFLSLLLKLIRGTEIYYFIFLMIHAADDKGRTMETVQRPQQNHIPFLQIQHAGAGVSSSKSFKTICQEVEKKSGASIHMRANTSLQVQNNHLRFQDSENVIHLPKLLLKDF